MDLTVLDIQRMSSEDGPGLRVTVFLKGCSLACKWCHNPESISSKGEVQWLNNRCLGCRACEKACPTGSLKLIDGEMAVDRNTCTGCFQCADVCPSGATEAKGLKTNVEKLCKELLKDRAYLGTDGGITVSGGEPLFQPAVIELLKLLKSEGVNTAVDTCGLVSPELLRQALAYTDIILFDIKLLDNEQHKKWTGQENGQILENFAAVCDWAQNSGRLWVRTPVIPGATDSEENIIAIGRYLSSFSGIERWELCAFNNLCRDKYKRLNIPWALNEAQLMTKEKMERLLACAVQTNACPDIRYTGALRQEDGTDE